MKDLTAITSSSPTLLQARVDAAGSTIADPRPSSAPAADQAPPTSDTATAAGRPAPPETDRESIDAVVTELQEALDRLSGPRRDVQLHFEGDGQYVVEVRSIHDGEVIQRFPPENLLNLRGSVADLLGTVVDRLS
jgi:uncharacterized FlaG/YvyC family protein